MQSDLQPTDSREDARARIICLLLVLITLALYWPVAHFEFNNYDDAQYLTQNPRVQNGLTAPAITWAFTTGYASNWHPLTWMSHMLDFNLFGFNAGGHHLVNALFHAGNVALLFLLLRRWTGAVWRSAFVAALFAWHPLHVESVAWVAERKDVLSAFFWLLTMLAYGQYTKASGGRARNYYLLTCVLLALGLMAKPMLVSLPLMLLLMDYWPLRRIEAFSTNKLIALGVRKNPLFLLALGSCVVTFLVQKKGHAVQSLQDLSLSDRLANAVVAYTRYLGKLFWPVDLAVIYPYNHHLQLIQILVAAILLIVVSLAAVCLVKNHPALFIGWVWFLITLVPVIGLVQVGGQSIADRYTYIPSIGLFIALVWEIPRWFRLPQGRTNSAAIKGLAGFGAMALAACLWVSAHQIRYWRNSITLFTRAIEITRTNSFAECNLGLALASIGRTNEAIEHERLSLQFDPNNVEAVNNLGLLLFGQGKKAEASQLFISAIKLKPDFDQAHYNLGLVYLGDGRLDEAIAEFQSAMKINPQYDKALVNWGIALTRQGHIGEAVTRYREALQIAPNNAYAHNALGRALEAQNDIPGAAKQYAEAIAAKGDFVEARENLGVALTLLGHYPEAEAQFAEALKLSPDTASIHYNLGNTLLSEGKFDSARAEYSAALKLQPEYFEAKFNLALALAQLGQNAAAIEKFRETLRLKPQTVPAMEKLAWLLATSADANLRDGAEALALASQAVQLAPQDPAAWDAQAAALAECGRFADAAQSATKAIGLAKAGHSSSITLMEERLKLYQNGAAYHEPARK